MRISCSATHIIAHITAWYACAYHTENRKHRSITQNSNRVNIASPLALNRAGICAVSVDMHLMKQNPHSCAFRGSESTFKANSTFSKDHVAKDRAWISPDTGVGPVRIFTQSVVEGEEALEGNLDLWAMCMRYPSVDIPVWFDPPGVIGGWQQ